MYVLLREYPTDFCLGRVGSGRVKAKSLAEHGMDVAVHLLHIRGVLPHTFIGLLHEEEPPIIASIPGLIPSKNFP